MSTGGSEQYHLRKRAAASALAICSDTLKRMPSQYAAGGRYSRSVRSDAAQSGGSVPSWPHRESASKSGEAAVRISKWGAAAGCSAVCAAAPPGVDAQGTIITWYYPHTP
eukprot:4951806-Prymnesium_polylepis.1